MRRLESLAKFCAILAGILLTFITLLTCLSVLGRETVGKTITGDFELSAAAAGAAVALFMPWCQFRRGNIIVDFFTTKVSPRINTQLDRIGTLLLALAMGVLAWRSVLGGLNAYQSHSGTMILGFPEWVVYVCIVPPLVLTTVIALAQTFACCPTAEESAA